MSQEKLYPTDLSEREWAVLEALLPKQGMGRPRKYSHRQMLSALFYLLRTGCAWRMLPNDLPPWQAVYAYFRKLQRDGDLVRINDALRELVRQREQREAEPSTVVVDSQSVKTTEKGGPAASMGTSASRGANAPSLSTHSGC
jgi:transposase